MTEADQTLWNTVERGYFPPGITINTLAECKDSNGISALHIAAILGRLFQNPHHPNSLTTSLTNATAAQLLQQTKDNQGMSAQDALIAFGLAHPQHGIQIPPNFLQGKAAEAHRIANNAIRKDSNLRNTATLWLGHVLALRNP